jgi:hypothetical protein
MWDIKQQLSGGEKNFCNAGSERSDGRDTRIRHADLVTKTHCTHNCITNRKCGL